MIITFNSFLANDPILYPQEIPENSRFSGVFREYKMGSLAKNELKVIIILLFTVKLLRCVHRQRNVAPISRNESSFHCFCLKFSQKNINSNSNVVPQSFMTLNQIFERQCIRSKKLTSLGIRL